MLFALQSPLRAYAETVTCGDGIKLDYSESDSTGPGGAEGFCTRAGHSGSKPVTVQASDPTKPQTTTAPVDQPQYVNNDCNSADLNQNNCGIIKYLVLFIKFLSAVVGIAVVASIIIGGIMYSASKDDPSATANAKKRIANALLALGVYAFMFALLQYLIPGGVL